MSKYGKSNREYETNLNFRILIPVIIIMVIVMAVLLLKVDGGPKDGKSDTGYSDEEEEIVEINGVKCTPKKNVQTFLFIGNDNSEEREEKGEVVGGGQCDTIELIVADKSNEIYHRLSLNRDTMTEIESLDEEGNSVGTSVVQLSLAYAQGAEAKRAVKTQRRRFPGFYMDRKSMNTLV